jgi:YD repeat-containing protein
MNAFRTLLLLACAALAPSLLALTVTADISSDTTWTSSDSPVIINPAGSSGGTITVLNGATLTIDASSGPVTVRWNENCDLRIGNGTDQGTLLLEAAGNAITFEVRTGGNIGISSTGQILCVDTTSQVVFTRYSTNTWGALDFEAGQTRTSELNNCAFSYGGSDSHNGILHIRSSSSNLPVLENLSFDTCTGSAIRMDGDGINVFAEGNVVGPISVSNTTYAANLQTTTATAAMIRFPDISGTAAPLAQFTGDQTIGSSSAISHVRFDDAWEFVEITGTPAFVVVQGSIWGTEEKRPVFRTTSGTSKSAWTGIRISTDSYPNLFGGNGPIAFVEIRNASVGLDIDKGTTYEPDASGPTPWRFPGLVVRMCGTGIRIRTSLETTAPYEGYSTIIDGAEIGGTTTSADCTTCVLVEHGRAILQGCNIEGATSANVTVGSATAETNDVTIRECRLSDVAATYSVNLADCAAAGSVTIERTSIFSATTGIYFVQSGNTSARALTVRNSCVTGLTTCLSINVTTASVASLLFEDSTIGGTSSGTTQRGILATQLNSSSTAVFRRCNIMNNREYGFQAGTSTSNTCEYTFEECALLNNGDGGTGEGGIRDSRSISAKIVATHCTFMGNNPWGVYDNNGTAVADAQNCYWGASDGPGGSGPGSGDAINSATNVDADPFLARPYVDVLLGGSPASASAWTVNESTDTPADSLHVLASQPYFVWAFGSDFALESQSAYQIQVASNAQFTGTLLWESTKTTSSATSVLYNGSALSEATVYYARIALWNQNDRRGPWRTLMFIRNSQPGQVDTTNRSPGNTTTIYDATPTMVWERPSDADSDPLHFLVEIDDNASFDNGSGNYRLLNSATNPEYFEFSTDAGSNWIPFPEDGVPVGDSIRVRANCPESYPNGVERLVDDTWYWRISSDDGFEQGPASATWSFVLDETYVFTGTVYDTAGSAIGSGKVIKVARNGSVLADSGTTNGSGQFTITTSTALSPGEPLVFFHDNPGNGQEAGRVVQFTGADMSSMDLRYLRVYVEQTDTDPIVNSDFDDDSDVDSDIPWTTDADSNISFSSVLDGSSRGVWVSGAWTMDADVTWGGGGFGTEEFHIQSSGLVRVAGTELTLSVLDNAGVLEVLDGALLSLGSDSQSSNLLTVIDSTVLFVQDMVGVTLTISGGYMNVRNSTFDDGSTAANVIDVTGGTFECVGTEFDTTVVQFDIDVIVPKFEKNSFNLVLFSYTGPMILWETRDYRSAYVMREISFDANVVSGTIYNVESTTSSVPLNMIGCTGAYAGEQFDKNLGSEGDVLDVRVTWETVPPHSLQLTGGDTRARIEWADVLGSTQGFQDSGTATSVTATVLTDSGATWTTDALIGMSLRMGTNIGNYKYYPIADNTGTTITIDGAYSLTGDGWTTGSAYRVSGMGYNLYRSTSEGGTYTQVNAAAIHGGTVYVDSSLSNGSTYWYYIKSVTLGSSPVESGGSARKSVTPAAADIQLLSPSSAAKGDPVAVSVVGDSTHWKDDDGEATLTYSGSNVTINDTIFLSPTLAIADLTLGASATSGNIQVIRSDLWSIASYDESVSEAFTASDPDADLADRPTLAFTTNNSGIAADADTSGSFILNIDFTDNGGGIDIATLEIFASRDIDAYFGGSTHTLTAGTELRAAGVVIESLDDTDGTWTIEQTQTSNGDESFANGEYTVRARVADDNGNYSEWASIRFYVEGANASVVKVADDSGEPVYLLQGTTMDVDLTGTSLSSTQTIDFGSGITVNSASGSGSTITVNLTISDTAACGPRAFTTNNGGKSGVAIVEYPTNIFPTTTNDEPPRNPAIGGVNVFLANGAFFKSETDLATRGRMMGMSWSRFYRSDISYNGPLGQGWMGHYFQRVEYGVGGEFGDEYISWSTPDGRTETFWRSSFIIGAIFYPPEGVYVSAALDETFETVTLTDRHGYRCVFNADGRLWRSIDRNGNATECSYNYVGQLVRVTDDRGYYWDISYDESGRVSLIEDFVWDDTTPREIEYSYDSSGNLVKQVAPETSRYNDTDGNRTTYAYRYDAEHRLTACINPREFHESSTPVAYLENVYDSSGRVTDQRLGVDGDVEETNGVRSSTIRLRYESSTHVIEVDRAGHRTDYTLDGSGHATQVKRFTGTWAFDTDDPYDNTALDSGTATGISGSVMTDSGASWTADAFIGMTLRMGTGGSDHQDYTIVDNDTTTITVDSGSSLADDGWQASDAYAIYDSVSTVAVKLRSGDPTSYVTTFTYNSNHEVTQTVFPRGNSISYTFPSAASQTSATADSCSGAVLTDGSQSWTTDAYAGMTLRMGDNQEDWVCYPILSNTSTTITVGAGFSLSGDGWGADDYAVYDQNSDPMAAGNVLAVTRKDEGLGSASDIVTSYSYEYRYQFVDSVTDPLGNTTSYLYDYEDSGGNDEGAGNLVAVTSPQISGSMATTASITTRTTYNEYGQPVTTIDGEGNVTLLSYYPSNDANDRAGFLYQRITAWGELDLTSEYDYNPAGLMTASWSPRAFESGATKDDYKTVYVVNQLNQTWHVTAKYEAGEYGDSSLESVDTYKYFDLNGNQVQTFREYITWDGNSPTAPSDEDDPSTFTKSANPMAATWVETSAEYNLLNYSIAHTTDGIAGSAPTRYTSRTKYDSNYNVIRSITPLGNSSAVEYDERDLVLRRTVGANSDVAGSMESDYDANGNLLKSRDALGNESTFTYDGFDRMTIAYDPQGNYRTSAFDANGNVTTSSAYDLAANLLSQNVTTYDTINRPYISARLAKDHLGLPIGDGWATSTTVYDKNSRVVSSTNDNGVTSTSYYDGASRVDHIRDAAGNETRYRYNAHGATTRIDYDEINGLDGSLEKSHVEYVLSRSDAVFIYRDRRYASGSFDTSTTTRYDTWGRVVASIDADATATDFQYDLLSRQTQVTRKPTGTATDWTVTQSVYDDNSRVITTRISTNPNTNTTWQEKHFTYDERDRVVSRQAEDGDIWTFQYDVNSNLVERVDPLGTRVTNTYDSRNLLSFRNIERGTNIVGATSESFHYDGLGRVTSCSNYDGTTLIAANAYKYNTLGLVERQDQTTASSAGDILATHTIYAGYDGTGFRTSTTYWDGRVVRNAPDMLNRLSYSFDEAAAVYIASYVYAGPNRVVERTYGNGTRTEYTYEASGCGCGGSTAFIQRVEHSRPFAQGQIIFDVDRRYDVNGNLTAERFGHEGDLGVVYRRDGTYRLTDTYYGVDLTGLDLETYADPAYTPTRFGLHREYTLDPRSNRSSVVDTDDSSTEIYDYSYSLSTDNNDLYTAVDGDDYSYDAIEQRTYDDATGLYYAYDYRGYLWLCDTDSARTTPEQVFHHDAMGNRVLEEGWYDDSPSTNVHKTVLVNDIRGGGGCGGNSGEPKAGEVRYNASDTETSSVQYVHGKGQGSIVQEKADNSINTVYRYRHEDQAGSLIGVTDELGFRTDEYFYLDFGTPIHRPILFDGGAGEIESIAANTPSAGYTRIGLYDDYLTADALIGKQLRALGSLHVAEVYDNGTDTIDVVDPTGAIYTAIYGNLNIVVMDFDASAVEPVATGTWTDVKYDELNEWTVLEDTSASFNTTVTAGDLVQPALWYSDWHEVASVLSASQIAVAGDLTGTILPLVPYRVTDPIWSYSSDVSTYTNNNANFEDWMLGWLFTPDVNEPCYLQIIEVTSATSIKVEGDARGLSQPDDQWRIHAPPGVDQTTGGLHTDLTEAGSRYLYGTMRYMPPQAGFDISGTIYGAQPGTNKPGNYYSGTYDPADGVQFQDAGDNKETKEEKLAAAKERLEKLETDPTEEGAVYKESSCHGTIETNGEYGKGWHWRTEGGENVVQDETANKTKEPNEKKRVRRSWNLQYELSFVLYATTKVENEDPDKWFYLRLTCTVAGSYVFGDQKVDGELERTDQVAKDFKTNTINENNKKKKEERKPWAHGWDDAESVQEKTYTKYARLPCVNKENAEVSFRFVQSELMLSRKWDEEEGKFVPSNDRMMIYDCGVSTASNGKGWQKAKGDPGNGHKIRSYSK